jgi:hypothetical protein
MARGGGWPSPDRLAVALVVALIVVRLVASAATLASGFRAVSDDDFARVVVAEEWAHAPRWDASHTSWLPAPFWIAGLAMKIAGRGLDTARVTAVVLGVAATLVVLVAARWMGEARAPAFAGAVAASAFAWSARLGVATVPELPTAALTLLAMASLVGGDRIGARRLLGGAALVIATLSRYEAWPVAAAFAIVTSLDARDRAARPQLVAAAALAMLGPVAWLVTNGVEHGDALHFLARVAAYRQALGGAEPGSFARLAAYPVALVREAPEVAALLACGLALAAVTRRDGLRARLRPYARSALVALAQIALLALAMIKDGAPTHHPERAMLTTMLLAAAAGGALAWDGVVALADRRRGVAIAAALGVILVTVASRLTAPDAAMASRADEEAIGREAAARLAPPDRLLVEVDGYGYLAVEAALGRPEDVEPDRTVDPRLPVMRSSFVDGASIRLRVAVARARWIAARATPIADEALGAPIVTRGRWGLYRAEATP